MFPEAGLFAQGMVVCGLRQSFVAWLGACLISHNASGVTFVLTSLTLFARNSNNYAQKLISLPFGVTARVVRVVFTLFQSVFSEDVFYRK